MSQNREASRVAQCGVFEKTFPRVDVQGRKGLAEASAAGHRVHGETVRCDASARCASAPFSAGHARLIPRVTCVLLGTRTKLVLAGRV